MQTDFAVGCRRIWVSVTGLTDLLEAYGQVAVGSSSTGCPLVCARLQLSRHSIINDDPLRVQMPARCELLRGWVGELDIFIYTKPKTHLKPTPFLTLGRGKQAPAIFRRLTPEPSAFTPKAQRPALSFLTA